MDTSTTISALKARARTAGTFVVAQVQAFCARPMSGKWVIGAFVAGLILGAILL